MYVITVYNKYNRICKYTAREHLWYRDHWPTVGRVRVRAAAVQMRPRPANVLVPDFSPPPETATPTCLPHCMN